MSLHPFFVHAPLVLIPVAALAAWFRRAETMTLFLIVAAAVTALAGMVSGLVAGDNLAVPPEVAELVKGHMINGIVLASVTSVAACVAIAVVRGWIGKRAWWLVAGLLTWMSVGVFFAGHSGATLVYVYGIAVKR